MMPGMDMFRPPQPNPMFGGGMGTAPAQIRQPDRFKGNNSFPNKKQEKDDDFFYEDDVDEETEDLTGGNEEDEALLGLFEGHYKPDPQSCWTMYMKAVNFDQQINLFETVRTNENFFIGKQWEGVDSRGLPTPQINILKRVCLFTIASIVSDNMKVTAAALADTVGTSSYKKVVKAVNDEFEAIFERNRVPALIREYARNAAVDGDGCLYTYWDADADTGGEAKGQVKTEILQNTKVFFGNPSDKNVQNQPWIIIARDMMARNARLLARRCGSKDWKKIAADGRDDWGSTDGSKSNDELVTVLNIFWKDDETGEVMTYCFTQQCEIEEPKSLGIRLYPLSWLNWDYVQDSYHGQAMITGLIPNQIFINKAWAMSMVSIMHTAFPTKVYDKSKISKLDNKVGAAYGVVGDVNSAIKVLEGASISPQVSQYIQQAIEETEQSLGATSVALGDTRPDNTSAIIALQRAASTPSELTKQNIYNSIEDLARIYLEFMGEYYGVRYIDRPIKDRERQAIMFAQQMNPDLEMTDEVPELFDFGQIKQHPVTIKLDVGASTYYSEIASIQTLENLLMQGQINVIQFLERLPDDYVPDRMGLISEKKNEQSQMMGGMGGMPPQGGAPQVGEPNAQQLVEMGQKPDINGGQGYGGLQRAINATGDTKGMV